MDRTDEELLHAFYAGDNTAFEQLILRHNALLGRMARLLLSARTGSAAQASYEWYIDERLADVWAHVLRTREGGIGSWPHQRLSALTWLIYLLCLELDRHLGLRGPF